ncbi:MAG: signal peptidase I [Undibacterium sp.]|nr:signal peptidase I [Opitutaceae bacterium]
MGFAEVSRAPARWQLFRAAGPAPVAIHPTRLAAPPAAAHPRFVNAKSLVRSLWRDWVRPLALPLLLIASAKSALADINYVPSGSMQPTILCGDVVFINKLAYDFRVPFTTLRLARWADPARGDVVVCFAPDDGTRLVKRIIGLPGDTIELRRDQLIINGQSATHAPLPVTFPGARDLERAEQAAAVFARENLGARSHAVMALPARPALRDFGPVRVPAGHYFMMGDNRDNSRDSRFFGTIPRAEIIGEAKAVVVSADLNHWLRPRLNRFLTRLE